MQVSAQLEFKPQDFWIGAFWKTTYPYYAKRMTDIWICILPMMPIHISLYWPLSWPGDD